MTHQLFDHQKKGIEFLKKKKRAILADEMGLGKTRQAIVAAGETSEAGTLVVCPASLKINWQREIGMVYPEDLVEVVSGSNDTSPLGTVHAWTVINYDILSKNPWLLDWAKEGKFDSVIFDEAHYIKDMKSQRTKAALAISQHIEHVYCLTGTPVMNRPIELFSLLRAVKHPLAWSEERAMSTLRKEYGKRYCAAYFHRLGYTGRGFWDETGASRIPELREMTAGAFLRRTKAEVLDLPEKLVSIAECELGEGWQARYDGAWEEYLEFVKQNPEKSLSGILDAQALVELMKLKQVCSLAKIDRVVADVENAVEQGQKVIVFSQFTDTIKRVAEALVAKKIGYVTLTGEDDQEARQYAVDGFQNNEKVKVFVANIKAGGVGITLTAASIVMFVDMEWSPEIHRQAEDRAHRIGQTGTVNIYYYVLANTIEEDIIDILTAKQETIGALTGGDTTIQAFMDRLKRRAGITGGGGLHAVQGHDRV